MAGSLYLGSQKVCPVIVQGGGGEPTGCAFVVPDDVIEISKNQQFRNLYGTNFPYDVKINFNNLKTISGGRSFEQSFCFLNIVSLNENIQTISGNAAFSTTFALSTIPEESTIFENLESISGVNALVNCFYGSKNKKIFRFTKLSFVGELAFNACFLQSNVEHIYFNSLTSQSFGEYTNQFYSMLSRVDGCTVHFPSNLESVIGEWSDVLAGFDGTNTTVLFDLPATE